MEDRRIYYIITRTYNSRLTIFVTPDILRHFLKPENMPPITSYRTVALQSLAMQSSMGTQFNFSPTELLASQLHYLYVCKTTTHKKGASKWEIS